MKFRMIAVILAFATAAWLPAAGQSTPQNPASTDSAKDAAKHSCCCSHEDHAGDSGNAANHDEHAMACCSKDGKASKTAMTCCNKDKDAKLCAAKAGKPCCDAKAEKSCCAKGATSCNSKAGKDCCTGKEEACCKHATA